MSAMVKKRTNEILDVRNPNDLMSSWVNGFLLTLIVLNLLAVVFVTVDEWNRQYAYYFHVFETFSLSVFMGEYVLRLWSCTSQEGFTQPLTGRISYALKPYMIIDLIVILPFVLSFLGLDLRALRIMRLFRLFRIFKLARYVEALAMMGEVIKHKKEELIITITLLFTLLLFASSLMYCAEYNAQPDVFSSIPAAMWWGIATLTTVGYGDITPVTTMGKFLGGIISIIGVGLVALPTGIFASGFLETTARRKDKITETCPHCQKKFHP